MKTTKIKKTKTLQEWKDEGFSPQDNGKDYIILVKKVKKQTFKLHWCVSLEMATLKVLIDKDGQVKKVITKL